MAHGIVTTGYSFPDATIQTTAADMSPVGEVKTLPPYAATPDGWLDVNTYYNKTTYSALNAVLNPVNTETHPNQLKYPSDIIAAGGSSRYYPSDGLANVAAGDRRITRVATNGSGTWIVLGDTGRAYRSTNNGSTWTNLGALAGATGDVYSIDYGNGGFVVGGASRAVYSLDNGATWTNVASPGGLAQSFYSMTYEPVTGRFVGISSAGYVIYSTDRGATWTNIGVNWADRVYCTASGQGYIVIASNGGYFGWSSNGGSSWTIDQWQSAGAQTANKIVYKNNRFFSIHDNGDICYTKRNSNPTSLSNWYRYEDPLPIRGSYTASLELTDISWIDTAKVWIIGTNGNQYFWAPDTGDDQIPYWYMGTNMHPYGNQGYNDAGCANGYMIQNGYAQSGVDVYGSPVYSHGIITYNWNTLSYPPSTHFYLPAEYGGTADNYYGQYPKTIYKY